MAHPNAIALRCISLLGRDRSHRRRCANASRYPYSEVRNAPCSFGLCFAQIAKTATLFNSLASGGKVAPKLKGTHYDAPQGRNAPKSFAAAVGLSRLGFPGALDKTAQQPYPVHYPAHQPRC